jgi:hypothetical protein
MRPTLGIRSFSLLIAAIVLAGVPEGCESGSTGPENPQRVGGAFGSGGDRTGGTLGSGGMNSGGSASDAALAGGGSGGAVAGTGGTVSTGGEMMEGTGGTASTGGRTTGGTGGMAAGATGQAGAAAGGSATGGRGSNPGAGGTAVGGTGVGGTGVGGGPAGGRIAGAGGSVGPRGGSNGGAGAGGATASAGGSGGAPQPSTFKVFDQIPQFGIYATSNPKNYTAPAGVLMWSFGTLMVTKLTDTDKARLLSKLAVRLTYHAQCDNYDRLGSLFFVVKPPGQAPVEKDPRVEIVRYITPFSDYNRGTLATHVYPDADISAYASTLADPGKDVWLGIASGANPYDGDPCTNAQVTPEFRQVGYKFSVEIVSSGSPVSGPGITLSAKSYKSETSLPVGGTFENPDSTLSGRVTVIVSGHGSDSGGCEYMHTDDVVRVNDEQVGAFSTQIDCATYASYSPDGNQGIFRNNGTTNPRNWCPGALVPSHTYPATLKSGSNTVNLSVSPAQVPSGSFYSTTINFTSP